MTIANAGGLRLWGLDGTLLRTTDELNVLLNDETWPAMSRAADDLTPVFRFPMAPSALGVPARRPTAAEILGGALEKDARPPRAVSMDDGALVAGQLLFPVALRLESTSLGAGIGFPWWDTFSEMAQLFEWVRGSEDGDHWSDVDQGWLFKAARQGGRLHFLEDPFDQGHESTNLSVDRVSFVERLRSAEAEARRALELLEGGMAVQSGS